MSFWNGSYFQLLTSVHAITSFLPGLSCNCVWFSTALRFVFSTHVELIQRADDDNNNDKILQGIYGLPFEIELPSSLPSSTFVKSVKRGSPSNCKLEVRANHNTRRAELLPPVSYKENIRVMEYNRFDTPC